MFAVCQNFRARLRVHSTMRFAPAQADITGQCLLIVLLLAGAAGRECRSQTLPASPATPTQPAQLPDEPAMTVPDDRESAAAMEAETAADTREPGAADSVRGTVMERDGTAAAGALVVMRFPGAAAGERAERTDLTGNFVFHGVPPGAFTLQVSGDKYTTRVVAGTLVPGQTVQVPQILMADRAGGADVQVFASVREMATAQVKLEEQQRVLGLFPNFYISYLPNAAPLSARNKWSLAIRSTIDPINFVLVGASAGFEQASNSFSGYGQGAAGYAKRYGAGFADDAIGTAIGGALLPVLLKQDPRYFWKGTGTMRSRAVYAMTRVVICKGDNGKWQPNYSNVVGNLASAGLSNLYYPASDRNGAGLTFLNLAIGTGAGALANLYQEFFSRRMTPVAERMPARDLLDNASSRASQ